MIIRFKELAQLKSKKTVYTGGGFDLLHKGHVNFFREIKKRFTGCKLVVGVSSDNRIRFKKGKDRPIIPQKDRAQVVDAIKYVDYTLLLPGYDQRQDVHAKILNVLKPRYAVYSTVRYKKIAEELCDSKTKIVAITKPLVGRLTSATQIINKIKR